MSIPIIRAVSNKENITMFLLCDLVALLLNIIHS